jgi:hypothetical protein
MYETGHKRKVESMLRRFTLSILALAVVAAFPASGTARDAPLTAEEKGLLWCAAVAWAKARSQPTLQASLPFQRIASRVDARILQAFAKRGYSEDQANDLMTEWEVGVDPATPLETACRDVDPALWR